MATLPKASYTFEQYLELEKTAAFKSEFHDGQIFALSGGTRTHSALSARLIFLLTSSFPGCVVYDSNLKLYIERARKGFYPDAMMLCGKPEAWKEREDVIVNPTLVAEVLSPSTENYDKETKTLYYRSVPSLRHILLVAQDQRLVDISPGSTLPPGQFAGMKAAACSSTRGKFALMTSTA